MACPVTIIRRESGIRSAPDAMPAPLPTESHFAGQLLLHRLPVCSGPPGPDAPDRKRLALPTGELAQLTDAVTVFRYLAVLELQSGTLRGNHVHQRKQEWFYLISGAVTLHARIPGGEEAARLELQPGDLVFLAPGVAHAIVVTAPGWAVEFSPEAFDPTDTQRHPVVPA